MENSYTNLWNTENDGVWCKSIYDPCPAGYRIASNVAFEPFFATADEGRWKKESKGYEFQCTDANGTPSTLFFPAAGFRHCSEVVTAEVGSLGVLLVRDFKGCYSRTFVLFQCKIGRFSPDERKLAFRRFFHSSCQRVIKIKNMFENYLFGYIACSIFDPWDEELVESAGNIDSFGQIVDFFGILLLIAFVAVVFAVVSVICKGIRKRRLIDPVEDHVAIRSFDGDCKTFKRKCKNVRTDR